MESEFRPGAYAVTCSKIYIGDRVVIRSHTMLFADPRPGEAGKIIIEDNVLIAAGAHVYTANHQFSDPHVPIANQGHNRARDVILRTGSWIGANAIILPGVEIGVGAVVGAGSVVTKSVPEACVAAGNPAHIIRSRFGAET